MVPSVCHYYAILDYEFAADTISAGKASVMDAETPIGFDPPNSLINGKSGGGVFELNLSEASRFERHRERLAGHSGNALNRVANIRLHTLEGGRI